MYIYTKEYEHYEDLDIQYYANMDFIDLDLITCLLVLLLTNQVIDEIH